MLWLRFFLQLFTLSWPSYVPHTQQYNIYKIEEKRANALITGHKHSLKQTFFLNFYEKGMCRLKRAILVGWIQA